MDWERVRRLFINYLFEYLTEIEEDGQRYIEKFLEELRKAGYTLTPELEQKLTEYLQSLQHTLYSEIHNILEIAYHKAGLSLPKDEFILRSAGEVIDYIYPDGLNLSQRLWRWEDETKRGLKEVLRRGAIQSVSAQKLRYQLQYALERITNEQYRIEISENLPKYLQNVVEQAKLLGPQNRAFFEKEVAKALKKIEKLQQTESISNAKQLIRELDRAIQKQSEEMIDRAVRWWLYNRQLVRLKTIAQTELANAFHLTQIKATEEDDDVIGYQWRLSFSHPRPDICDVYATMDYGLGKGVFPKTKVPRRKPHPHCLCYLIPITRRKHHNEKEEPEISREVLMKFAPKWIQRLVKEEGRDILEFWDMERGKFITQQDTI
ncbi:MAG: hypothetical protein QXH20_00490 [Candidatus Bathyarchaeia archaeon]